MTTVTHRRTVAEMENRLVVARKLIEDMRADAAAKYDARGPHDARESWVQSHDRAFEHGCRCGLEQALAMLDACFSPERDWMYSRP